jgi:gluconate transporter
VGLLITTLLALALLLALILRWRVHAFLALLIVALLLGLAAGMAPAAILASFAKGVGDLLGSIAVLIGAGAILARLIEISGSGSVMAERLIAIFGPQRISWAMLFTGYLVGIPVFFDAGFLTLIPLAWALSERSKRSLLYYALPILASLTVTHGLIPTHPGPAAAALLVGADLGRATIAGLLIGIPSAIAGGIVYGVWMANRTPPMGAPPIAGVPPDAGAVNGAKPPFASVLMVVLLPLVMIASGAFLPGLSAVGPQANGWLRLAGDPSVALLVAVVCAFLVLGKYSGLTADTLRDQTSTSLNSIGSLLLIIGAAGAFKQVIVDSGAGNQFAAVLLGFHVSPLLSAFVVGAALRIALGSATASIATAASLVAPLAATYSGDRVLLLMSLALGGSIFSNVNDAGFWMVKEYCGMTIPDTLKIYSTMKAVASIAGFAVVCLLALVW